ncbi:MAG: FecR domain-containing protein [Dehalococcoidia bacterium]|nr:FecR domain-containing protein [Dehalococcoidia bacterium]
MGARLSKVLDECIARVRMGETLEACLAGYPSDMQKQLEPLLQMALLVSRIPRVSPSEEFSKTSKASLIARLSPESVPSKAPQAGKGNGLARVWQELQHTIRARRVAIPLTAALIVIIIAGVLLRSGLDFIAPPPAMASSCTLSVLNGSVEFQKEGADSWQSGTDDMTLTMDTKVKTAGDAHAVLTFFEGSTIKLEPDTLVGIEQMGFADGESSRIVVKQFQGRTWSHVEKISTTSYYEIETPSASVTACGTLFAVDVNEAGATKVTTSEGLVSVIAQGEKVDLAANQQAQVEVGAAPSKPERMAEPKSELIITTDMPAVGSVCDPTGSSTGYLPSGLSFNQITDSKSSLLENGTQVISIAQPVAGEYILALRYITQEAASFNIVSKSGGRVIFEYSEELSDVAGEGWVVHINLNIEDEDVVSCTVVKIESLGDLVPEKVVVTELAEERAVPIEPTTQGIKARDDYRDADGSVDNTDTHDDVPDGEPGDVSKDDNLEPVVTPDNLDNDSIGDKSDDVEPGDESKEDKLEPVVTPDRLDNDSIGDKSDAVEPGDESENDNLESVVTPDRLDNDSIENKSDAVEPGIQDTSGDVDIKRPQVNGSSPSTPITQLQAPAIS